MKRFLIRRFRKDDGAISVDWVVLSAAIIGVAVTAVSTTGTGLQQLAGTIQSSISQEAVK